MTLALLPLNHLHQVKSRLAALTLDRPRLALQLLEHVTLAVARAGVAEIWVVSPEPVPEAQQWGARWCRQTGQGLNPGLEEARQLAVGKGFQRLLVVLPDLPYLQTAQVEDFLATQSPNSLRLAPDRWGRGTNMWLSNPVEGLPFQFGDDSCAAHRGAADRAGWDVQIFQSEGSEKDLDTPEDWEEFRWTLPSSCCP